MNLALRPATRAARLLLTARLASVRSLSSASSSPSTNDGKELGVGELQGASFRIAPLRREGETDNAKRARLLYQSRKRGTLETDLIFSTFAAEYLSNLPHGILQEYDELLDENDWDLYYWATQSEPPTEEQQAATGEQKPIETATEAQQQSTEAATEADQQSTKAAPEADQQPVAQESFVRETPPQGEWARTIGNVRAAYRPVPERWRDSHILRLLRNHVRNRSVNGVDARGMRFMPPISSHFSVERHPEWEKKENEYFALIKAAREARKEEEQAVEILKGLRREKRKEIYGRKIIKNLKKTSVPEKTDSDAVQQGSSSERPEKPNNSPRSKPDLFAQAFSNVRNDGNSKSLTKSTWTSNKGTRNKDTRKSSKGTWTGNNATWDSGTRRSNEGRRGGR